jgi:hypothetical protein
MVLKTFMMNLALGEHGGQQEGKEREAKGREGKGREGKGRGQDNPKNDNSDTNVDCDHFPIRFKYCQG